MLSIKFTISTFTASLSPPQINYTPCVSVSHSPAFVKMRKNELFQSILTKYVNTDLHHRAIGVCIAAKA